ncbi:elongation factor 4 [Candidatus Peregrinibacteria bacterium]|jgi:GTP-binding protein LepA|nr:elongation factor 4 [Candidatus Peregrinibacteria bacterium]
MDKNTEKIRNFCIIAHIDHGKSTLADRFLEVTGTVEKRDMKHGQVLDTMELEQERGITIKLQPVRMEWQYEGDESEYEGDYILNLIDTPGHVDFSYEVSRSIAACEGAILVVDATQGIEAQTLANCYMALDHNLEIIPVLNKIDLPSADIEARAKEIENVIGVPADEIIAVSAKEGTNVEKILDKVIEKISPPKLLEDEGETKALIFDSIYDPYKGVVTYIRLMEGDILKGDKLKFLNTGQEIDALEIGYFKPQYQPALGLKEGEIGYVVTGLKSVGEARVGDTLYKISSEAKKRKEESYKPIPLPGYKKVTPFVYAGVFCVEGDDFPLLRKALEKLSLNDAAVQFEPEQSGALGHGFRCGFLGLLHLEIVQERLEREYDLDIIVTAPSVSYILVQSDGEEKLISNPCDFSPIHEEIREPWMKVEIVVDKDYVGAVMKLLQEKRGVSKNMSYLDEKRVLIAYEVPLASIVMDFYDKLKSVSSGYASMSYEFIEYRRGDLIRLDILLAGDKVDAFAIIIHRNEAQTFGGRLCKKLKTLIPKAQFAIAIQAAIGSNVIARETISAMRKDVTAKLYGGDVSRKRKLLEKQKKGKKRMKMFGKVEVPQKAFLAVLKQDDD